MKLIDKIIYDLNVAAAANLSYITNVYGQASTLIKQVQGQEKRIPAVKLGANYTELFPNGDNLIFGVAHDPARVENRMGGRIMYRQEFSIIVWLDQTLYQSSDLILTDEIIADVVSVMESTKRHKIELQEVYKEPNNVYQGFDYEIIKSQYLMHPYTGFRLLYEARFWEQC